MQYLPNKQQQKMSPPEGRALVGTAFSPSGGRDGVVDPYDSPPANPYEPYHDYSPEREPLKRERIYPKSPRAERTARRAGALPLLILLVPLGIGSLIGGALFQARDTDMHPFGNPHPALCEDQDWFSGGAQCRDSWHHNWHHRHSFDNDAPPGPHTQMEQPGPADQGASIP